MKNKFLSLLFFIFSTAVFSQDIIVSFTELSIKKALKTGQFEIGVDNTETIRELTVPAKTPLGVIKYFKGQGYDVEIKLGMRSAGLGGSGYGVTVWNLFCTKKEE